ncbi:glycerol-3-phosphate dehydrogenase/oxidase [Sphingobacteriales bacterium UPWRP_1]|nr:glycerol-3-phosphate dehydrogenase [Sphingobacteriales bacterium TSM_CSS]PSJ72757.1 glycerol-3-phosphate dehydrogenase/oxidase [Sphingobacteriales bacterium UPWRP_1]
MDLTRNFTNLNRPQTIAGIEKTSYDLIIIGGGITGAGIALDAASRGLKTLLLEMQDFAAGTSSRSTKLIHGGLRYLKQLEVGLVREVGQERALLYSKAPHIVHPKKMLLPIIENGSLGVNATSFGLYMYDWLAGVDKDERRSMHTKAEILQMEPLLRDDLLLGGGLYYEYQTDDARLTIEVLKTANKFGATCLNYAEVTGFHYHANSNKIAGIKAYDHIDKVAFSAYAKQVVNAAGPWVDAVRAKDEHVKGKRLHLTKGVHVVVPYERLPLQQAAYFNTPADGRMIFAIPRGNTTYIGTTDTTYTGAIANPQADAEDVEYILNAVNFMFPTASLTFSDVLSTWTGLRPLIHEEGKAPSALSRKDEIFYSHNGLISIAGGKLTGFRKMAERTVDAVMKELYKSEGRTIKNSITDSITLSGGHFMYPEDVEPFIHELANQYEAQGITVLQMEDLVYKYGSNTLQVLQFFEEQKKTSKKTKERLLLAELRYGVQYEMVSNLSDFLIRRTGRLYFERPYIEKVTHLLLDELEKLLGLNKQQKLKYYSDFEKEYLFVVQFKEVVGAGS